MTRNILRAAALLTFCTLASASVAAQETGDTGQDGMARSNHAISTPVAVSVHTDRTVYGPGDAIKILITLTAPGTEAVHLRFPTSQHYDLIIQRGRGRGVQPNWIWSHGRIFASAFTELTVSPDRPAAFTVIFNAAREHVQPLKAGKYTLQAIVTTAGRAPRPTSSTSFTIRN